MRFLVLNAVLALIPALAFGQTEGLRAGAATSNITPWLGLSINGSMSNIEATHVHDELYVRCFVFGNGDTKVAFAVVDSCAVPLEMVKEAKARIAKESGIPEDHVLISATHSHSAGAMTPAFQTDADTEYQAFVARRIADGVRRAVHNMVPARLGVGVAPVPHHLNNRRWRMKPGTIGKNPFGQEDQVRMNPAPGDANLVEPAGPTDSDLSVLWADAASGGKLALLANYGLHYVGGVGPGHLSADYFGSFARAVEDHFQETEHDPPFVAMMTNGTSGDVNNINFRVPSAALPPYQKIDAVASDLARRAEVLASSPATMSEARLDARSVVLDLGVRKPDAARLAEAQRIVDAAGGAGATMKSLEEIYARESLLLSKYPDKVPVTVQAMRIGDVGIVAIPCEVFAEIGLDIKARSPFKPTIVIELANGYNGYLPTKAQHALGGYETWAARSSYLEVDAADKIVSAALKLLDELK